MKKNILIFIIVLTIMLVSCDTIDPNDTILVQSPQNTEEATLPPEDPTIEPIPDITEPNSDTLAPDTSSPDTTDTPAEDTYDKEYSGRY